MKNAIQTTKSVGKMQVLSLKQVGKMQQMWFATFVENVVTHIEYRNKGYATSCLNYAKEIALSNKRYKMMLLTGSKRQSTLRELFVHQWHPIIELLN